MYCVKFCDRLREKFGFFEQHRITTAIATLLKGGMRLALKALVQSKSATGRIRRGEPGAAPQEIGSKLQASAEGATHAFMTRAFSADVFLVHKSWGVAPG